MDHTASLLPPPVRTYLCEFKDVILTVLGQLLIYVVMHHHE